MLSFLKSKRKRLTDQSVLLIKNLLDRLPKEYDQLRARQGLSEVFDALYVPNPGNGTVITLQAYVKSGVSEAEKRIARANAMSSVVLRSRIKRLGKLSRSGSRFGMITYPISVLRLRELIF
jgi:hypothetical protein